MRFSIRNIVAKNWPVLLVILIASFLRLYRLDDFVTFLGDQGRDAIIVKRIITLENFPAIGAPSSIGQVYLGPFYYYLISPFLLLFNFNPVGLAFAVAVISIIGLITAYLMVCKEVDLPTAIIFLILSSFSLVLIDLSRFSWNPNLLPVFSFVTLYFFVTMLEKKTSIFALLFGAFLSFSTQLHYLALLLLLPIFILYTGYWVKKKITIADWKNVLVSIGSFGLFLSPLILFDITHSFLNARNLIKLFTEGQVIGDSSIVTRFLETNQSFFKHIFQTPFAMWETLIFFLVLFFLTILLFRKSAIDKQTLLKVNAINIITYLIGFSLITSVRHIHYFGTIYLSFFLVLAYMFQLIKKLPIRTFVIILFVSAFIIVNAQKYYFVYGDSSNQINQAKKIADSFEGKISAEPIQLVPIPQTETDGHYRYFIELNGHRLLSNDSGDTPEELYVMCFRECKVLGNGQWQIAAFSVKPPQIQQSWTVDGVTIYKLIH